MALLPHSPSLLHVNDNPGEYPPSWYAATAEIPPARPALEGEHQCDVCVVGAGYTGLSTALHLARQGFSVIVVEAHRAGWGASGRNGGQAASGHRIDQEALEAIAGKRKAHLLWDMAEEAKALVRGLIEENGIDCQPQAGVIHADHKKRYVAGSRAYVEKLQRDYGYEHIRFLDADEVRAMVASPGYFGGAIDTGAFHLHPLRYALGLAAAAERAGVRIFEHSEVTRIRKTGKPEVRTAAGSVTPAHVVIACNGYLGEPDKPASRHIMPINNFIIATEPLGEDGAKALISNNAAVADSRFVINYFRLSSDHRLLFGGGENYGYRFPADIKRFVRKPMLKVFPQLKDVRVDYGWGGTLAITMKRVPLLWKRGKVWHSSGYSGHGITIATLAGKLIAEAIAGQEKRFDLMAKLPTPAFPGGEMLRGPMLALAMSWYALRDRL